MLLFSFVSEQRSLSRHERVQLYIWSLDWQSVSAHSHFVCEQSLLEWCHMYELTGHLLVHLRDRVDGHDMQYLDQLLCIEPVSVRGHV